MKSDKLYFQWIKGDNAPNIEVFNKEITLGEETYFLFESGQQVNKKLIDDFVVSIPDDKTPFINPEDFHQSQQKTLTNQTVPYDQYTQPPVPINEDNGAKNLGNAEIIPHPDDLKAMAEFNRRHANDKNKPVLDKSGQKEIFINNPELENTPNHQTLQNIQPVIKEKNPVEQLIEKSKKYETEITLNLKVNLPSKEFLNIIKETFEGNEQDIVKYILALFKTSEFDKKLEEFVREYLSIEEPKIVEVDEKMGNLETPPLKKESGEKKS